MNRIDPTNPFGFTVDRNPTIVLPKVGQRARYRGSVTSARGVIYRIGKIRNGKYDLLDDTGRLALVNVSLEHLEPR
jgi:hypothetical protein